MNAQTHSMLASWRDGAASRAIVEFVEAAVREGEAGFIPQAERIAVFDNDGTLWCEQPMQVQLFFVVDALKRMTVADPSLLAKPAYKALASGDFKTLLGLSKREALEPAMAVHAGMSVEAFRRQAGEWMAQAAHPQTGREFQRSYYQPQRELLDYLRVNGFKTFIVTGGGVEFVRTICETLYGIPPEQVIGSSNKYKLELGQGGAEVMKLAELSSFDDREEKVANIALHIGRRPVLAFGNSDGDLAMTRYTLAGPGPRLGLLLHHDDEAREFAYDRHFRLSPLADALDNARQYGITVVSMRDDWERVFPD